MNLTKKKKIQLINYFYFRFQKFYLFFFFLKKIQIFRTTKIIYSMHSNYMTIIKMIAAMQTTIITIYKNM
jgi:hypothetical protein